MEKTALLCVMRPDASGLDGDAESLWEGGTEEGEATAPRPQVLRGTHAPKCGNLSPQAPPFLCPLSNSSVHPLGLLQFEPPTASPLL